MLHCYISAHIKYFKQVSSASDCIRIPHHHSHTATEHQHTSNQVCEVQIQYLGDIITTCYTKHSITIRHHGSQYLRNTLSKTATPIKTNNALINSALTQTAILLTDTTHEVTLRISRKLLRMDVLTSETCWALNKVIIKQVASSWSLFTQLRKTIFISSLSHV